MNYEEEGMEYLRKNARKDEIIYNKACRLTTFVKPKTKKTILELSKRFNTSPSKIVCNILEKHIVTMEIIKK